MKLSVALVILVVVCSSLCAPDGQRGRQIISRYEKKDRWGQYALQYLTEDGTLVREQGRLKLRPDGRDHVLVREGSWRYVSPEGRPVSVSYVADEGGFRTTAAAVPSSSSALVLS